MSKPHIKLPDGFVSKPNLLKAHDAYMGRWKAEGKPFLMYITPCCGRKMDSASPANQGETWDSFTTCPHCDSTYYKRVSFRTVFVRMP